MRANFCPEFFCVAVEKPRPCDMGGVFGARKIAKNSSGQKGTVNFVQSSATTGYFGSRRFTYFSAAPPDGNSYSVATLLQAYLFVEQPFLR